jgi:hypothetical protein
MSRPRFRLSTLLWLTLAVACWFGGMTFGRWRAERPDGMHGMGGTGDLAPDAPIFGPDYPLQ